MTNIVKTIQEVFISRVKNMLFLNFIIAWLFTNYTISLTVFFKDMPIDEKIAYIDGLKFDVWLWLVLPLLISLLYIFIMPLLNLVIVKLYDKFVTEHIKNHEGKKLIKHYRKQKDIEKERLESITFVERDLDIDRKRQDNRNREEEIELNERDNKANKEKIELVERENKANTEAVELVERENRAKIEATRLTKEEIDNKQRAITLSDAFATTNNISTKVSSALSTLNQANHLSDAFTTVSMAKNIANAIKPITTFTSGLPQLDFNNFSKK